MSPTKAGLFWFTFILSLRLHLLRYALLALHNSLLWICQDQELPKWKKQTHCLLLPKTDSEWKLLKIDGWKTSLSFLKWSLFRGHSFIFRWVSLEKSEKIDFDNPQTNKRKGPLVLRFSAKSPALPIFDQLQILVDLHGLRIRFMVPRHIQTNPRSKQNRD